MAYLRIIETTVNWTCPETGDYKIICVAGGCSAENKTEPHNGRAGGSTSFGSYLTAAGTPFGDSITVNETKGMNGYTISNSRYGSFAEGNMGIGYGASAAAGSNSAFAGCCGKMTMGIFSIDKDTSVQCTVGKGGIHQGEQAPSFPSGSDGVIIIQKI